MKKPSSFGLLTVGIKMQQYEFNIVVVGVGNSVDEAFSNVLASLKRDPKKAIINEVVYVAINNDSQKSEEIE